MADKIIAGAVFDRIRELYGLASDAAMARRLDIYPQDVPRRREKGNVPFEAILTACPAADWPYIFLGAETPKASPDASAGVQKALDFLLSQGYQVCLSKGRPEGEGSKS